MSLQPKNTRQQVCDECNAMKNSQEYINAENAKKKKVLEDHWWRIITSWTNVSDVNNPMAGQTSLKLPLVNTIDQSTINSWSTQLTAAGYTVTIEDNLFVVSL
ncbi:hypothetical protein QKU48_gp0451 [Fadolivirus algeromassiliense]|jgi:hypothetical protein|uniref:Uncharacterized protein n=1 Tax=Fadolivirus FV1/VV64 TaxID=3070911 RepID=A0A7D3UV50_9VIRU|nr:hypothetical protein QKU48_gp0451 [Fadolivirus algeromassiliense]QKF93909.1 hypothetical protein Fadolivirus_1_451 [Fadolivirus FV1/VV64]